MTIRVLAMALVTQVNPAGAGSFGSETGADLPWRHGAKCG